MDSPSRPGTPMQAAELRSWTGIQIRVGYPWTKADGQTLVAPHSDSRWVSIRDSIRSTCQWVETHVANRLPAPVPLLLSVGRLRGSHGQMLLDNLRRRIQQADVLILDIGSSDGARFNPNVLLEAGMALGAGPDRLSRLFILKPAKLEEPSDLHGFLFTLYHLDESTGGIKLHDSAGFHAALRSVLLDIARDKGMVGPPKASSIEWEEDEDKEQSATTPVRKSARTGKTPRAKARTTPSRQR